MTEKASMGFLESLRHMSVSQTIMAWDFVSATVLSAAFTIWVRPHVDSVALQRLVDQTLMISAALFGVLLAGLAIVAAVVSGRLAQAISENKSIGKNLLKHFVFVGGLLIGAIVTGMAYGVVQTDTMQDQSWPLSLLLGVALQLTLWSLFASLELLKLSQSMAVMNIDGGDPPPS